MVISFQDFNKLDIRVVKVLDANHISGMAKIVRLTVDIGSEENRTIIAGGAEFYKPEYFIGKKFVALVNLTPKRIAGVESQGMLLAAEVDGKPVWLAIDEELPVGTPVR